jgi:hypothetical protein
MKQTAVEFLINEIPNTIRYALEEEGVIEQAKEIEKEQIKDAYTTGVEEDVYSNPLRTGEMYYNETYGGNK